MNLNMFACRRPMVWAHMGLIASISCSAGLGTGAEPRGGAQPSTTTAPAAPAQATANPPPMAPTTTQDAPSGSAVSPTQPGAGAPSPASQPATDNPNGASLCQGTSGRRIAVASAAALNAALASAQPLDVITLAPGTYSGSFVAKASGTPQAAIALCGTADTLLVGPSLTTGYTLYLQNAQYWQVVGLTVTGGAKGIMLDGAAYNLIKDVTVSGTGSEGIHLRSHSHDNVVDGCRVSKTGIAGNPKFGEGIYIGSSVNNWCSLTQGKADQSDRNTIQNCTIAQTTAEAIDIKEGTTGGRILNNTLDGLGIDLANASSLVNVKGNSYLLQGNKAQHAPEDAFSIHVILPAWGACNAFVGNTASDALSGMGIHLAASKPWPAIEVSTDNLFPNAAGGTTNAPPTTGQPPVQPCTSSSMSTTCSG